MISAGLNRFLLVLACCFLAGAHSCFAADARPLPAAPFAVRAGSATPEVSPSAVTAAIGSTASSPGSGNPELSVRSARMRKLAAMVSTQDTAPVVSLSSLALTLTQFVGLSIAGQTITLTNVGSADLAVSQISVTGAFTETDTCGTTVAAGSSCTISVTFTPTSATVFKGTLTISDNAAISPQSVRLTGAGIAPLKSPTLSATSLAFGSQVEKTTSAAQTITLTNDTAGAIAIVKVKVPTGFASSNNCNTWVVEGASCAFSVTFTPTASGPVTGTLSIQTSVSTTAQSVAVSGSGYTVGPSVLLSPSPLAFAAQTVGTASAALPVTLTNDGTSALAVSGVSTTGNFAETNNCGSSVAVGASCVILVTFTPTATGTRTGTLSVTDNATDSPESMSLTGPGQAAIAKIWLNPAALTFPTQTVGAAGSAQAVSLVNTGTVPLAAFQATTTGDFTQGNNCPSTIAVGAGCSILVTFIPSAPGARSGILAFADSAGDSLESAALAGTGLTTPPAGSLTPTLMSFQGQTLNTTSASQVLTLTNSGGSTLTVTGIALTGDFAETDNCPASLAPGASCAIVVTFTPTVIGVRNGTVSITGNGLNSPQTAGFAGTGLASTSGPGCVETGTVNFPGCLSFASPTEMATSSAQQPASAGVRRRVRPMDTSASAYESEIAAETAQLANLLDGVDPAPGETIAALAENAMNAIEGVAAPADPCFRPALYYTNDPEAAQYNFAPTGQWSPSGLSLWTPADSSGTQACAAAEMNGLLSQGQARTQLSLALAAETEFLSGTDFPFAAGQSFDATSALAPLLEAANAPINVTSATVTYDQGSYLYVTEFTASNSGAAGTGSIEGTLILIHSPGISPAHYSGILEYGFDNGVTLLAGTTRYQRTGPNHFDLSVRDTVYPTRTYPQLDANDEIDPNDPNFILSFSRFGASFDPTAALTPGSFLYTLQTNASGVSGPGPAEGLTSTLQLELSGDGTGSAFLGSGTAAINQPTVWQVSGRPVAGAAVGTIDGFSCAPQTGVAQLYAQLQPVQYSPATGQYVPSTAVASRIRFAPVSTCVYTDAQWNNGAAGGFWYDRAMQFTSSVSQPATPAPIPQNVVADPNDSNYPFSLFGDGATEPQTIITAAGYTFPVLY